MINTLDLKEMGVAPMDEIEMRQLDGGIPVWFWQGMVVAFAYDVVSDWDANVKAFKRGLQGKD